jgi:hypothetical protein
MADGVNAGSARRLTVVTAANQPYWRCLFQFLRSAERRGEAGRRRFVVYDLGLTSETAALLEGRFSWCEFRRFPFEQYPPHVAVEAGCYAWKPMIVESLLDELGGQVLWLDSATVLRQSLDAVAARLERDGCYTLKGQAALAERCDPLTLEAMAVEPELRLFPERVGGVVGLDAGHSGARKLAKCWHKHALIERHIQPRVPKLRHHKEDQALLTILLHRLEAAGELALGNEEIDISSRAPVRWMSSRNMVPPWLPLWCDPLARAYYASAKAIDRWLWRVRDLSLQWINGAHRALREHYTVFVAREGRAPKPVAASMFSYYADPFLWQRDGGLWLLVEEFRYFDHRGRLCAIALDDDLRAGPPVPILPLRNHASFPFLLEIDGTLYLMPETCADLSVDLYECEEFPHRWRRRRHLLRGVDAADSILFEHGGYWWLLTSQRDDPSDGHRYLAIYYADDPLRDSWHPHPVNRERRYGTEPFGSMRNAGGPIRHGDALLRPVHSSRRYYGESVSFMQIDVLTTSIFRETPYRGSHPLAELAGRVSPHHVSRCGAVTVWDCRDRAGAPISATASSAPEESVAPR